MIKRFGGVVLLIFGVLAGSLQAQSGNALDIPAEWLEMYPGIKRSAELKTKPKPVKRENPLYPDELRERGIKGSVRMAVALSPKGKVLDIRLIETDHPDLVEPAMNAIEASKFAAGKDNGKPVFSQYTVRMRIGGNDEYDVAPRVYFQQRPIYPNHMRMAEFPGRVTVGFLVSKKGDVEAAYSVQSSHPAFRHAAIDAVEKWKFRPATKDGKPVAAKMTVPIIFSIGDDSNATGAWNVTRPKQWPEGFPESMKWDKPPGLKVFNPPVYPRQALLDKVKGTVRVQFVVTPEGSVFAAKATSAPSPELAGAAVAAVETFQFRPARKNGQPCGAILSMEFPFKTTDSSAAPVTYETNRVLGLLRKKSKKIVNANVLDSVPKALLTKMPTVPLAHRKATEKGTARVEFVVSRRGVVELAKVLEATAPEYGYAAIQAMSEWQFEPPRKDGKVVDTRLVVPVVFEAASN
ncbi:MAG: hypothetical protein SynsKO_04970 [Synoicihabitans sp.]